MTDRREEPHFRDDAEDQPESGYPEGHVSTKPSAEPAADEAEGKKGSEAEFDSRRDGVRD
jgi:hypothetical protein